MDYSNLFAFCLMGPTAIGKTDLALHLADHLPIEIISVDSAMIYQGMDIGTAKPDVHSRQRTPHHLIDILTPDQPYSAGAFCRAVTALIPQIIARGRIPLLVGGTMLYFKSLQQGMADIPAVCASIRQSLWQELHDQGLGALYQELQACDPALARRLHANDQQRILRGLEVYRATGQTLSVWQKVSNKQELIDYFNLVLWPKDRHALQQRINERFVNMMEQGFIAEVEALRQRYPLSVDSNAMRAVGYRQVWHYLDHQYDWDTLIDCGCAATRQLAKRQLTWLRRWPDSVGFVDQDPQLFAKVLSLINTKV